MPVASAGSVSASGRSQGDSSLAADLHSQAVAQPVRIQRTLGTRGSAEPHLDDQINANEGLEVGAVGRAARRGRRGGGAWLLYTSDAADERSRGDLGGRRIITKKYTESHRTALGAESKGEY